MTMKQFPLDQKVEGRRPFLWKCATFIGGLILFPAWTPNAGASWKGPGVSMRPELSKDETSGAIVASLSSSVSSSSSALTVDQHRLLVALLDIVFPADGNGPSSMDVGVAETLAALAKTSDDARGFYGEGLIRFDRLARQIYADSFTALDRDRQHEMLRYLDQVKQWIDDEPMTLTDRVRRKLRFLYYTWRDVLPVANFWFQLREKVLPVYYSHDLTWNWLGYPGPPFRSGSTNGQKV